MLLLPTTSYRAEDFLEAADRLGVAVTVASETDNVLQGVNPAGYLTLDYSRVEVAIEQAAAFVRDHPVDAVVATDDAGTLVAAAVSEALGLPHNPLSATHATRNKLLLRQRLLAAGVAGPQYRVARPGDDPQALADAVKYPCVLKPVSLHGSRGVIRADDAIAFVRAFARIEQILAALAIPGSTAGLPGGPNPSPILIEEFIPGPEYVVEGILDQGELQILAILDKPDPLDGPFFEETIYVTPSRCALSVRNDLERVTAQATAALGLREGPIHAELRQGLRGCRLIELAARSIGGLCSRTLRFGVGVSLEELILKRALGGKVDGLDREESATGVLMLPIKQRGILRSVEGLDEARRVPLIEEVRITIPPGDELVPLPEGSRYLGFVFARGNEPAEVEEALREAQARLRVVIQVPTIAMN